MNNNRGMDDFGRDVRKTIEDAINTGNFSRMNSNINNTFNRVFNGTGGMPDIKLSHDNQDSYSQGTYHGSFNQPPHQRTGADPSVRNRGAGTFGRTVPFIYKPVKGTNGLALAAMWAGYGLGACQLFAGALTGISMPLIGAATAATAVGTLLITALPFFALGIFGTFLHKKCRRFRSYIDIINGRDVCNLSELAEFTDKNEKFILGDVEKLINKGWFCQGHLDKDKKCLMLTEGAYQNYKNLMIARSQQERDRAQMNEAKKAAAQAEQKRQDSLDPAIRETVKKGQEYIRSIRRANDAIPGKEVSDKMDRMENLVRRIFQRVEEKPETASELKRLMDYYLPMAIKLLNAYEEMDRQPVQGENIVSSKKEIEDTLDTLNVAFEKLLDDMFRDTAWDVSSDVSVLKTMLAREGLTKNDFEKGGK